MTKLKDKGFYILNTLLIIFFIIIIYLFNNIYSINIIKGDSMNPTFNQGNVLIAKKTNDPNIGDIVVFDSLNNWGENNKLFIKRVIAKGGDELYINKNILYVNNIKVYDLNKVQKINNQNLKIKLTIEDGYYFVMGDNVGNSLDSLYFFLNFNFDENFLIPKENIKYVSQKESQNEEIKLYVETRNKQK